MGRENSDKPTGLWENAWAWGKLNSSRRSIPLYIYCLILISAFFVLHGIYFTLEKREDERYLRTEILSNISSDSDESILIDALSASFHIPPHRGAGNRPEYGISHPLLKVLGPPASLIHKHGGHCGRRTRLLISILALKDIPAHKVHLINPRFEEFNHSHKYVHAVTEAKINGRWVVADPLYNIVFRKASGKLSSIEDIRGNDAIFTKGIANADTRYASYHYELYTYDEYRKFIWNSIPGGEVLYGWIEGVLGEDEARQLSWPTIMEQPLRTISIASYIGAAFFGFISIFALLRHARRIDSG